MNRISCVTGNKKLITTFWRNTKPYVTKWNYQCFVLHIYTIYNSIKPTVHKIKAFEFTSRIVWSNNKIYTDGSYHTTRLSSSQKENVCLVDVTFNQSFSQVQDWNWSERLVIKYTCHTRDWWWCQSVCLCFSVGFVMGLVLWDYLRSVEV